MSRARVIRVIVYLTPLLGGWLAVRSLSDQLYRPGGTMGLVLWAAQAMVVAGVVASGLELVTRRLLPLANLFELTLSFPDQTPSRFRLALRSRTVSKLITSEAASGVLDSSNRQKAAEEAITMVAALNRHDRLTRGHAERVRAYADLIAQEMGLSRRDRDQLAWGVVLHDIGKLAVPEAILNKKSKLTEAEWDLLMTHPEVGAKMLTPLAGFLGEWGLAAGDHHERWDGDGYPLGLSGNNISLSGRITAVADTYDVITALRSYKKSMSPSAALQELVRCSGSQFDPDVVRAMLSVSVGQRAWRTGPLSWIAELPSVLHAGSAVATVPAAVATSGLIAAASLAPIGVLPPPEIVAFTDDSAATLTRETLPPEAETAPTTSQTSGSDSSLPGVTISDPTTFGSISTSTTDPATTGSTLIAGLPTTTESPIPTATSSTTASPRRDSSTTVPSTSTSSSTTSPATPFRLFLLNPGIGDTTSAASLPLALDHDDTVTLSSYDTDRNSDPGLTINRDNQGLSGTNPDKYQDWTFQLDSAISVEGDASVTLWVKSDNPNKDVALLVGLELCNPECSWIGSGTWAATSTGGEWTQATIDLGPVSSQISPGSTVRLRVVVPKPESRTKVRIAYDTVSFPSHLNIS